MVKVVNWNPKNVPVINIKFLRRFWKKPVNNFGDLIGPMVVNKLLELKGITNNECDNTKRLLTVGSIFFLAENNDTVWGSGFLNDDLNHKYNFESLDIRAVRGPLSRNFLIEHFSIDVPEVYGDPALLVPELFPELKQIASSEKKYDLTIIPHFNEYLKYKNNPNVINPRDDIEKIFKRIALSKFVVGSSLHGIILAEAFNVPARLFLTNHQHLFKYRDYYEGTGRSSFEIASSIEEAIQMKGERLAQFDREKLIGAFPYELFIK